MACYSVDEDVVSVWASICPVSEIPENYFELRCVSIADEPMNPFSADFGFELYDEDFVESYCHEEDWRAVEIGDLIRPEWSSYCETFRDMAIARAKEVGVGTTAFVFLIYNFHYDPDRSGVTESRFMRFVGAFPFKYELPDYIRRISDQ